MLCVPGPGAARRRPGVSLRSTCSSRCNERLHPLPPSELTALSTVYDALGGPNWTINFGWASDSDPCVTPGWFGVTCSVFGNASHVTALSLPRNNLRGVLPPLADLEFLVGIDLSNQGADTSISNMVSGTLGALCGLGRLKTVELAYNSIAGGLPPCLHIMVAVTSLDLSFNAINGTTPDEVCDLVALEVLNLRGNQLRGTVPECLGDLPALRTLDYTNVNADGSFPGPQSLEGTLPATLCRPMGLEFLAFQVTQGLSGHIPDCIGRGQPQLYAVDIQGNQFSGVVPESLCEASGLQHLYLYKNRLTGTIPSCIGDLTHLTLIQLQINDLHGPLPEELCRLVNMQDLDLYVNRLTGTIPSCLGDLPHLTYLQLSANDLHGPVPEELCRLVSMQYLGLNENRLTGTIPSCIGDLTILNQLDLSTNGLRGSLPASLCGLVSLQYLQLNRNHLDGTLPTCFGTSFPELQVMFLHDNRLGGRLPMAWNLPSLINIALSNNAELHGPLPPSLFSQQLDSAKVSSTPKHVLRVVVIEGTGISGAIPWKEVCNASQLQTLALSGNRLTGSVQECLFALKYLQTLRAAHNQLDGTLSGAIRNLPALAAFDLGYNDLTGRVPPELGDLAPQLEVMSLEQNFLACELPASVRHWQAPANKSATKKNNEANFKLLKGNSFGCGGGALTLSMQDAPGIRHANSVDAEAYSCGGADYVLPVIAVGAVAMPSAAVLPLLWWFGVLRLGWRAGLSWRVDHSLAVEDLHKASRALSRLGLGVAGAAAVSAAVVLGLVLSPRVATSPYECEYASEPTLANKGGGDGDMALLSCGVGAALGLGLMLGLAVWWYPWLTPDLAKCKEDDSGLLYMLGHDDVRFGGEREAEAQPDEASSAAPWLSIAKACCLFVGTVALAVGPNVAYVLIVLSDLSYMAKIESEVSVTVAKSFISALVIPQAARLLAELLVPAKALSFARFQVRLALGTALAALSIIITPAIIVLVTDERCLYDAWHPPDVVTTDVVVEYCFDTNIVTGICQDVEKDLVQSTYAPAFDYDGSRCVSAVLSTYAPVFLAAVLLTAAVPAAMELLVVPSLAPWCHRNSASSPFARNILLGLCMITRNVPLTLQAADRRAAAAAANSAQGGNKASADKELSAALVPPIDVDYLAQRVVERGIAQLIGTLLVALSFGLAAPPVGGACALAALVQVTHHQHVLGTIVACGIAGHRGSHGGGRVPDLKGSCFAPSSCATVVVATVLLFWGCASVGFLDPLPLASAAAAAALACALLWVGGIRALRALNAVDVAKERAKNRGRSGASVASSAGMSLLEEPLVAGGEGVE